MSHRYTYKIKVAAEHLDGLNHVNNLQYLLWAQDIENPIGNRLKNYIQIPLAFGWSEITK